MKQSEKIISAIATIAFGIVLIILRATFIEVLMTVAGIVLIALGVMDALRQAIPPAVFKIVVGLIVIICGWTIVEAVLYIVAAVLLIAGALLLYDKLKNKIYCTSFLFTILEYAKPAILLLMGVLLLFNQTGLIDFIFIASGVLTILEGGIIIADAVLDW